MSAAPSPSVAPAPSPQRQSVLSGFDLNTFPGVANASALEQQGIAQLDAQLNKQRQNAVINFGDPNIANLAGFGIDPAAAANATQNYQAGNATLARLDSQHKLAAAAIVNQLAAHGILNSGDYGYREGQENQGYGNNVYDAQQSVLGQLTDLYSNYLSQTQALHQNSISAQLQSLQDYLSNPDLYAPALSQPQPQAAPSAPSPDPYQAPPPPIPQVTTTYSQPGAKKPVSGPSIFAFK